MAFQPHSIIVQSFISYHHHHRHQQQRAQIFFGILILWSTFVVPVLAQVGLRTSPLTAPENKSNQGLFSKWTEMSPRQKGNDSLIDYKLGAIFRGVAYGVSTISPSPEEMEEEKTTRGEEHQVEQKPNKIPDVVAHVPDMNVVSTSPEEPISNLPQRINTMLDSRPHYNDYTEQNKYEDDLLVTQDSTSHVNVQESVGRPVGDSRIFDRESKNHVTDLTSKGPEDDLTTHEVVRQNMGPWGEPTPDWSLARQAWGFAWEVHVYTVATLYSLLALFAIFSIARVHVSTYLLPRGYYITLHLLLFLGTFFRSVYLFHDPYSYEGKLPASLSYVLFNTGAPCLFGALAVLILALLRATRTHLLPHTLQTPLILTTIVTFHLGLSIAADVVAGVMGARTVPLHVVVQAVTAIWGATLCVGYAWAFSHIEQVAVRQQGDLLRMTFTRVHLEGDMVPSYLPRPSLSRGARLTLAATVTGLLLVGLQAYRIVVLQLLWVHHLPQPWPWYGYHSASRALEILMWTLIGVASALPLGNSQGKQRTKGSSSGKGKDTRLFSMFCKSCAGGNEKSWDSNLSGKEKMDVMYPTICQTNQAVRQFTLQTGTKVVYDGSSTTQRATPQRNINTEIMPSNKRSSVRNASSLHSKTSDVPLLWSQCSDGVPCNASSRPSSTLFRESGIVRVRTQVDPQQNKDEVFCKISQNPDKLWDDSENPKKTPVKRPRVTEYINDRYKQNSAQRSLKKSQKNVNSANRYDDLCGSGQFVHLLQNRINSELYSETQKDSTAPYQSKVSATDYSSVKGRSPKYDPEWSKYASTCSSISATNSFDVKMYNDFEVASYYHPSSVPATGSSNLYSSLHKPSRHRTKLLRQHTAHVEEVAGVHRYEDPAIVRDTMEQLTALLAPQTCAVSASSQSDLSVDYLTDVSASHDGFQENGSPSFQGSDSDACSNNSRHYDKSTDPERSVTASTALVIAPHSPQKVPVLQPSTPSRCPLHIPFHHDITPGSAFATDYSGQSKGGDLKSGGEDGDVTILDMLKISSNSLNDGIKDQSEDVPINKLVENNFSVHGQSYRSSSNEEIGAAQHVSSCMGIENSASCDLLENQKRDMSSPVRPCGHRPRRRQGKDLNSSYHQSTIQQQSSSTSLTIAEPSISSNGSAKLSSVISVHSNASHTTFLASEGATQTESPIRSSQSLESSRPSSSQATHSDLVSKNVGYKKSSNLGDTHTSPTNIENGKRLHKGGKARHTRAHEETGV